MTVRAEGGGKGGRGRERKRERKGGETYADLEGFEVGEDVGYLHII